MHEELEDRIHQLLHDFRDRSPIADSVCRILKSGVSVELIIVDLLSELMQQNLDMLRSLTEALQHQFNPIVIGATKGTVEIGKIEVYPENLQKCLEDK